MKRKMLPMLLGCSLGLFAGCGGDGEGDGSGAVGGVPQQDRCSTLTDICDACEDAANKTACLSDADTGNETTCQQQIDAHLAACFPASAECEQLLKVCSQCTIEADQTQCEFIASNRIATAEGCMNFDFNRFASCPQ